MRTGILLICITLFTGWQAAAQKNCRSFSYLVEQCKNDPSLKLKLERLESQMEQSIATQRGDGAEEAIIRIPVVVHVLYHYPSEKITDQQVITQINALNKCFRRQNADTANTPFYFRPFAADCRIEFQLAISDPKRRSTSGIIRKYTPIKEWAADDKMKYNSQMGDDAWDPNSYLNIWVCNLDGVAGYASVPGDQPAKDGIVIGFPAFGTINTMHGYEMGKTAVHEVGHWLNLRHLWGDDYCGDDGVADTPKQAGYNIDCPGEITVTCGNGPYGDMYMDYMDLTSDACMNLFTTGQKARMRACFDPGAPRNGILSSKGLNPPLIAEVPLPEADPRWLYPQLFPNPAGSVMTLDLSYDPRWIGKTLYVTNLQGQAVMSIVVSKKLQQIDLSRLQNGLYILRAKKDDGESLQLKFIKL